MSNNKLNKKLFYNDLMRVFEIITEICEAHEGATPLPPAAFVPASRHFLQSSCLFLESSLLIKKLYELNNYIKNDTNFNRNMETLSRCRNPMSSTAIRSLKKLTCNKCGRKVVNIEAHQKREICIEIEKEKQFSNQFKTDDSVIITTIAKKIITDFWRKYKTRSGAGR
jgi:hypothetical protein